MGTERKWSGAVSKAGFSCCFEFLNQKDMLTNETCGRKKQDLNAKGRGLPHTV